MLDLVLFQKTLSLSPSFLRSPKKTSVSGSMIEHYLPTEIAVSTLSPVAIIVLMFAYLCKISIILFVTGFNLFCITKNPRK